MNFSWRSKHFVPALAVGAVMLASLGASWFAPGTPAAESVAMPQRPSLESEVRVVKAPPTEAAMQPASCRDCGVVPAPTGRY